MTDEQLLETLSEAARGLTYMSETDHPVEVFNWGRTEPTPEFLRVQAGVDADAPVGTQTPAEFFRAATSEPDWKGPDEITLARRFQALLRLLEENLSELNVFRVGALNTHVYVAGRSGSDAWLGVSTRVVET
jgi:hypothetical protein